MDPHNPDGSKKETTIPGDLILRWFKYQPVQYENLRSVKHVLDNPKRIFSGIRELNEGGWCYVGKPEKWYVKERCEVPFPTHLVFAVYLNDRMAVYNFRAEKADTDDALSPINWKNRFGGLIWKSIS